MTDTVPTNLWELLNSFDPSMRFPLIIVLILFGSMALVFTIGIVALTVRSMHKHRLEDALKRDLLDRGLAVDEIERIVRARSGQRAKDVKN